MVNNQNNQLAVTNGDPVGTMQDYRRIVNSSDELCTTATTVSGEPDIIPVIQERVRVLKKIRSKQTKHLPALRAYYKDNPADFINHWGVTLDPRKGVERGLPALVPPCWPHPGVTDAGAPIQVQRKRPAAAPASPSSCDLSAWVSPGCRHRHGMTRSATCRGSTG